MKKAILACAIAALISTAPAGAWSWPAEGQVLRPFSLGENPFAAGHHRGVDIAAPSGSLVRAPAGGDISFAGTVPHGGKTVTIRTADGWSVTLVHLGSLAVRRGDRVAERDAVGTIGPSGETEHTTPYVHLGVRRTDEDHGYVDPLLLLPEPTAPGPPQQQPTAASAAPTAPTASPGSPPTASAVAAPPPAEPVSGLPAPGDGEGRGVEREPPVPEDVTARAGGAATPAAYGERAARPVASARRADAERRETVHAAVLPSMPTYPRRFDGSPSAVAHALRTVRAGRAPARTRRGDARTARRPPRTAAVARRVPGGASASVGAGARARAVVERGSGASPAPLVVTGVAAVAAALAGLAAAIRRSRRRIEGRSTPFANAPCPLGRAHRRGKRCPPVRPRIPTPADASAGPRARLRGSGSAARAAERDARKMGRWLNASSLRSHGRMRAGRATSVTSPALRSHRTSSPATTA